MEDNEQPLAPMPEASAPQVAERPLWKLSRDEQRILIITFVGGLASIIAGACVIGVAIALVRWLRGAHNPHPLGVLIGVTALIIIASVAGVNYRRGSPGPPSRGDVIISVVNFALILVLLLIWIGLAAGVH